MARGPGRPPSIPLVTVRALLDAGWSQGEIARYLGVAQPSISYVVNVRLPREEERCRETETTSA